MNAEQAIENYRATFKEFETIVEGIKNAKTFTELAPYEQKMQRANYSLRVSQNQAIFAVANLANERRTKIRLGLVEPVEKKTTEKKPVDKSKKPAKKKAKK